MLSSAFFVHFLGSTEYCAIVGGRTRLDIELKACDANDPRGHRAASVLAAYFRAAHARAFRQLLWRRLAVAAVVAWLIEATTPLLPRPDFVVALLSLAAVAAAAAVAEWRAEHTLRALANRARTVDWRPTPE
jgi:hypothetical protein